MSEGGILFTKRSVHIFLNGTLLQRREETGKKKKVEVVGFREDAC
jgi:hypothetical protein